MRVAGKCPPNPDELAAAAEMGFDAVELYLEPDHLDAYEKTLANCRNAPVDIVSVHTPHVSLRRPVYLREANRLAEDVDADVMCVHSSKLNLINIPSQLEYIDYTVRHGFENSNGFSPYHIKNTVFGRGLEMTLDTAHLYTAVADDRYLDVLREFVVEYGDRIPLMHFCDSTDLQDGLPLGEGDMPTREAAEIVKEHYDGVVVLEVMPEHQEAALETFREY